MLERRRIGRTKVLKGARIVLNQRAAVVACVVRDLTNVGACIHVADAASLPQGFDLALGNLHTRRRCAVIWAEADRLGVAFV
jgi:hypothetical protein